MKVADSLAKNILVPLGITATVSAIETRVQKQIHGSGTTTLIISNEEMNGIRKIVQALTDYNILFKEVTEALNMKQKNKNEDS